MESLTGLLVIWDGYLCKVNEMVAGFYRITCFGASRTYWAEPFAVLRWLATADF